MKSHITAAIALHREESKGAKQNGETAVCDIALARKRARRFERERERERATEPARSDDGSRVAAVWQGVHVRLSNAVLIEA